MARRLGVQVVLPPHNGDVIRLAPGPLAKVGEVHAGRWALDGERLIPFYGTVINERHQLMGAGIVHVGIALAGSRLKDLKVHCMGISEPSGRTELTTALEAALRAEFLSLSDAEKTEEGAIIAVLRKAARHTVDSFVGKKPEVTVQVQRG